MEVLVFNGLLLEDHFACASGPLVVPDLFRPVVTLLLSSKEAYSTKERELV
jgi:hypothetical protein